MPKNLWLKRFDPADAFVWRRVYGDNIAGETVVKSDFTPRRLKQLYDGRMVVESGTWNEFVGVSSPASDKSRVVVDSAPVSDAAPTIDPRDELRHQLEELDIAYDNRWGENRLTEELEKATAPAPTLSLPGMSDGAA